MTDEITVTDMNGEVTGLARERALLAELEAELAERRKAFDIENEILLSKIAEARALTAQHDHNVRALAYAIANERGEMRPHPATLTKRIRVPIYEPREAVTWAMAAHLGDLLDLKKRAYEKALLSGLASDMPGHVSRRALARTRTT